MGFNVKKIRSDFPILGRKVNGKDFIYEFAKSRLGDLPFVVADNQLALQLLDWKPKRDLFDMCNDSFNIK